MTTDLTIISLLKDWIIPIGVVVISVWFASSAKRDADRAQIILTLIKDAVEGSQRKMIESATGILDSLPQVITGKSILALTHSLEIALKTISENISNPKGLSKEEHDRNILALSSHLTIILEKLSLFSK